MPKDPPIRVYWVILAVTVLAGLLVRVIQLDTLPSGLYCDEAANGYKAYSILKTGKDVYGEPLPLFFRHHDADYLEGLYTYLSVPVVSVLGLNVFSTRLLAAVAGSLTILFSAQLARELFGRLHGLTTALLVAFAPWQVVFSRVAFRGILLPLFLTVAVYLFVRGLKDPRRLVVCGMFLGLTLHTYSVARLLIPLVTLAMVAVWWRSLSDLVRERSEARLQVMGGAALLLLFAIPVYQFSFFGSGNTRVDELSIFGRPNPVWSFVENYLLHLSPGFLFFDGDPNLRHSIPGFGGHLLVTGPLVAIGVVAALRKRTPEMILAPVLLLLGLVPVAVTNEGLPHGLRSIGASVFLEVLAAGGALSLLGLACEKLRVRKMLVTCILAFLVLGNAAAFLSAYFGDYRLTSRTWFQYGMEEAIRIAESSAEDYDGIVIAPRIRQSYSHVLFFAKSDPIPYQENRGLGKYAVNSPRLGVGSRYLIILPANSTMRIGGITISEEKVCHWVRGSDGKPVLKLVELEVGDQAG